MKLSFTLLAIAVAGVHGESCPSTEYAKYYDIFPAVGRCSEATGYGFFPPKAYPTDQQVAKMCETPACVDFIKLLGSKNPSDCDITEGGAAVNFKKIVDDFTPTCAKAHPDPTPVPTPAPTPTPTSMIPTPNDDTTPLPKQSPTPTAPGSKHPQCE